MKSNGAFLFLYPHHLPLYPADHIFLTHNSTIRALRTWILPPYITIDSKIVALYALTAIHSLLPCTRFCGIFTPSPPPLHWSNHLIALRAPFSRLFSLYGRPVTPITATQPHRKAGFHRKIRHLYHKIESFSGYKISNSRIAFTSRVTSAKIACNLLFFCVRRADVYKAIFRLVRKHTVVAQQIYVILLMY